MDKSPLAVACLVGVYMADCIYVPLKPSDPARRLAQIVDSCRPRLVLEGEGAGRLPDVLMGGGDKGRPRLGWVCSAADQRSGADFTLSGVTRIPAAYPPQENGPGSPAHIFTTSGSTGTPKGVVVTHASVISFIRWAVDGRTDSQVERRGYRIELGEIEAALNALDMLRESVVVAIPGSGLEDTLICCAYVPNQDIPVNLAAVRGALLRLLPDYMIPARWSEFRELPKNASGKIDRTRLKETWQYNGVIAYQQQ